MAITLANIRIAAQNAGLNTEGQMVAQAIAYAEGGLDRVNPWPDAEHYSFGPFSLFYGTPGHYGQLYRLAQSLGLDFNGVVNWVREHMQDTAEWALKGYLGNAIREGQAKGIHGRQLALYAGQYGQGAQPQYIYRFGNAYDYLFGGKDLPVDPGGGGAPPGPDPNGRVQPPFEFKFDNPFEGIGTALANIANFFKDGLDWLRWLGQPNLWLRAGLVVFGIVFTLGGIVLLAWSLLPQENKDEAKGLVMVAEKIASAS